MLIEEVSVSTAGKFQIIPYGKDPEIIPYGVNDEKGRVALLSGVFLVGPVGNQNSLTKPTNIDGAIDVLQDSAVPLGLGLTLKDATSYAELPELGAPNVGRWQINSFQWDRAAIKRGQWKFQMELGYIWNPALNELKLYENNIGTNTTDNVKFSVCKVASGSPSYSAGTPIYNTTISTTIIDLNRAEFSMTGETLAKGDIIKVFCETQKNNAVFFGVVTEMKRSSQNLVEYICVEVGTLLQRVPCAKIGPGLFKPKIKIKNPESPGNYYTLQTMVATIMRIYQDNTISSGTFTPGLGTDKSGKWGALTIIPGTGTNNENGEKIPPQLLSGMNVFKALSTLLEDQCGLHFWFHNDTGALEYGFVRNKNGKTIAPATEYIVNSSRIESNSDEYTAGYVVVFNSEGYYARFPTTIPTDNPSYVSYIVSSSLNDMQLRNMARRIYNDGKFDRDVFKVTFPAGTVKFLDGDVFTGLGDATVNPPMLYRGPFDKDVLTDPGDSVWQIKEMTITEKSTVCIVGASFYSVFDIYRNKLKKCSEAPVMTESKDVTTNSRVITKFSDIIREIE